MPSRQSARKRQRRNEDRYYRLPLRRQYKPLPGQRELFPEVEPNTQRSVAAPQELKQIVDGGGKYQPSHQDQMK